MRAPAPGGRHVGSRRRVPPASGQPTGVDPTGFKDALSVPTKVKKIVDAFVEARELRVAAPVASAAEAGEVAGEQIETELDPLTAKASADPALAAAGQAAAVAAEAPTTARVIMRALGHSAKKGLGALGILGGGVEAIYGGKEIASGRPVQGSADVVGGSLNVAAGASQLSTATSDGLATGLKAIGAVDEIGGRLPVAGPLVGAASVITGGVQMVDAIARHDASAAVTGGVKTAGGAVMIAGAFLDTTIAGAPAGVVLNGVGGAMILAGTAWDHRQAIATGLSWTGRRIAALF